MTHLDQEPEELAGIIGTSPSKLASAAFQSHHLGLDPQETSQADPAPLGCLIWTTEDVHHLREVYI